MTITGLQNNTGLLWYCDNPGRNLADKIGQAARRYRQKYGTHPNLCYVHPSALSDDGGGKAKSVGGVRVAALPSVLVHHFWIGEEKQAQPARAEKPKQGRLL